MTRDQLNALSQQIIEAAIAVHRQMGPGLLESVYQGCMAIELAERGLHVQAQVQVPVIYNGHNITPEGFRLDLLVNDTIIIELKSVEQLHDLHRKQLLTYLKLAHKPLGLLINFNVPLLKDGIVRIINTP
jgi:GxxExxY protein